MQREEEAQYAAHPNMHSSYGAHRHAPQQDEYDDEDDVDEEEGYEDDDYEEDEEDEDVRRLAGL